MSKVAIFFIQKHLKNNFTKHENKFILIGGDVEISCKKLILLMQNSLKINVRGWKCIIITIPNKFFYTLFFQIFWISPEYYEALLRISSNLSGYLKASKVMKSNPHDFPIKPYFWNLSSLSYPSIIE